MDQAEADRRVTLRGAVAGLSFAAVLGASGVVAGPSRAEHGAPPAPLSTIRVEGTASEAFSPDKAVLSLGVVTERPRAIDAAAENGKAVKAVIDVIKAAGIEARAIQSASVTLEPVFKQTGGQQTISGFRAGNDLEVEVAPPDRAGLLAGTLIETGVNTISGIRFESNANAERADRLRGAAVHDARHKAEVYVAALGLRLGRVIDIAPTLSAPLPMARMASAMKVTSAAVPLEAGQQSETAGVTVTWELVQ